MNELARHFSFGQPWLLLLLLLIPAAAWLHGRRGRTAAVRFSAVGILRRIGQLPRASRGGAMVFLMLTSLALMALGMARPRLDRGTAYATKEGIDIVFCVDISGSMESKDFLHQGRNISRREGLIMAIGDFVDHRPNDRFAMIGFAGSTYLLSPLTTDSEWIKGILQEIRPESETAIGDGILSSLELLKEGDGLSKVIILVTDGGNNAGSDPQAAAQSARGQGVRVHTIEVSTREGGGPGKHVLEPIAGVTGGAYFQASSPEGMIHIYRQIDLLEKTKFEVSKHKLYDELFPWFVAPSFALLLLSWIGSHTLWMRLP